MLTTKANEPIPEDHGCFYKHHLKSYLDNEQDWFLLYKYNLNLTYFKKYMHISPNNINGK